MKHFLFLFALLLLAGCANEKPKEVSPAQLLLNLADSERYASTDQVADWLEGRFIPMCWSRQMVEQYRKDTLYLLARS